jgi:ribosomal protein L9
LLHSEITQDTFEEAVLENMETFGSQRKEAIQDVIKELGMDVQRFEQME